MVELCPRISGDLEQDAHLIVSIVDASNRLLAASYGPDLPDDKAFIRAMCTFRCRWTLRYGNHLEPLGEWSTSSSKNFLNKCVVEGAYPGYPICGERSECFPGHPADLDSLFRGLLKDVRTGRLLLFTRQGVASQSIHSCPLIKLPAKGILMQERVIHDLRSANILRDCLDMVPDVALPCLRDLVRSALYSAALFPRLPLAQCKGDVAGAFKNVWLRADQMAYTATDIMLPSVVRTAAAQLGWEDMVVTGVWAS